MTTNKLTVQILEYLLKNGHFVERTNNIPSKKYYKNNVKKGKPDIMGCSKKGIALAVEIKNPDTKDKQSDAQKEFENHYNKRGGIYIIAGSLDDIIKAGL
jgi:hypothetical protein